MKDESLNEFTQLKREMDGCDLEEIAIYAIFRAMLVTNLGPQSFLIFIKVDTGELILSVRGSPISRFCDLPGRFR